MRAAELLQKSIKQTRQYIDNPHKQLNTFVLIGILIILLSIPLIAISVNQARPFEVRAEATLTVTPDPVPAYTHPTVAGTGFEPSGTLLVGIPGDLRFTNVTVGSSGSFSFLYTARDLYAGYTYTMEAWGQGHGNEWVLIASSAFEVIESSKPGDLNYDGKVDVFDLSILLSNWGASGGVADINKDGTVDIFDLSILLSNWGG